MDYVLTEHARDALAKRRILTDWMERALTTPELIEADPIDADLEHWLTRVARGGECYSDSTASCDSIL